MAKTEYMKHGENEIKVSKATTADNATTVGSTSADTGTTSKPIYLVKGVPTQCDYALDYTPQSLGSAGTVWASNGSGCEWRSMTGLYTYRGTYDTLDNLLAGVSSASIGDVYNLDEAVDNVPAGTNWACMDAHSSKLTSKAEFISHYDPLGGSIDLTPYSLKTNTISSITGDGTSTTVKYEKADGTEGSFITKDTVYTHPTTDGYLHVPATGTGNNGKFLMAGSSAGSLSWETPVGTTYKAGDGLTLTGNSFSVNTSFESSGKNYKVMVDSSSHGLFVNVPWTDNDTKNTAGSTEASSKIFLVGAASQATSAQTYSRSTCYLDAKGENLYVNGNIVVTNLTFTDAE